MSKVRQFVSKFMAAKAAATSATQQLPDTDTVLSINEKGFLIIATKNSSDLAEVRGAVSDILEGCKFVGATLCCVCYDASTNKLLTCGHILCDDCGKQYASSNISENRFVGSQSSFSNTELVSLIYLCL